MVHHSAESQPHFVSFLLNRLLRDSGQVDKSWWLFLHHKPLVLGDLTSDMGTTLGGARMCFSFSPGHVEWDLCGPLTVRSASERSVYSVLQMTKTSETQSYTILRPSPCNFKSIKATSKGVGCHFLNAA